MARYGQAYKDRAVARLLPPESAAVEVVVREMGVGAGTLRRWRKVRTNSYLNAARVFGKWPMQRDDS